MEGLFEPIEGLIDVQHLGEVRLGVVGGGRVALEFLQKAVHHGIRQIRVIDPDTVVPRNFSSGFPETAVGMPKVAFIKDDLERRRRDVVVQLSPTTLTTGNLNHFTALLNWCTVVGFFIDSFDVVPVLVERAYGRRMSIYAGLLDTGRVGEAGWSNPGQTPCLNCSARLREKVGVHGGQTLLVDVSWVVAVAFRQFMGLCLIGRRGFELFAPFVDPRRCFAYVINGPSRFLSMPQPDTPCGVRLVEVVDGRGRGPSCPVCRGYRP